MRTKMTSADEELYQRVDEVLHYIWDPIGVSDTPTARNEYHSYLPHVFSLIKTNADAEHIAEYLFDVSTQQMELPGNRTRALQIAELLLDWKDTLVDPPCTKCE
jgi:hypothetical protein